jgi:hypothetical protein
MAAWNRRIEKCGYACIPSEGRKVLVRRERWAIGIYMKELKDEYFIYLWFI